MSAPRRSAFYTLRWDLLMLFLILVCLWSYKWLKKPYVQTVQEEINVGSRPPDRTEGDILLLLPDVPAVAAQHFQELDCSYGWFNALWQEYGSFASALTRNLSPEILAGRSVVIVPKRVAKALPSTGITALESFVRQGGQLVIEQPPSKWSQLTKIKFTGKTSKAQNITSTEGLSAHGPMRKHLPMVPLVGMLQASQPQEHHPKGPVLMEVDGQPGYLTQRTGLGQVHTLLFNFGCTTVGLQQGTPVEAMRFDRRAAKDALIPTSARSTAPVLHQSKVPYADLLERAVLHHLSKHRPLPKLWSFPGTHSGAFLLTHPTPMNTRAALGLADWSRKKEATSTIFTAPDRVDLTQGVLFEKTRADIGLLWVRGWKREKPQKAIGIGALNPISRELTLQEQLGALRLSLPVEQNVRIVRSEGTMWTNDWATTFGQLSHAQLRLDNSFGPSTPAQSGYLFGTGYPFYPLDTRGLPMPLLEAPFLLHEGSLTRESLRKLLANSQAYFHQSITVSLPAHAMRTQPSAGIMLALRDAHFLAKTHKHWVATLAEWLDFLSARRQSKLTSQWSESKRRLTISLNLLGAQSRMLHRGAFPGVAFPRTYRGEEIEQVMLNGKKIPLHTLATTGSGSDRILQVSPGRHTVFVFYKIPVLAEPTSL